jgi:hypothetical protein
MSVTGNDWYDYGVLPIVYESDETTAVFVPLGDDILLGRQMIVRSWSPMQRGDDAERVKWHAKIMDQMHEEHGGVR